MKNVKMIKYKKSETTLYFTIPSAAINLVNIFLSVFKGLVLFFN